MLFFFVHQQYEDKPAEGQDNKDSDESDLSDGGCLIEDVLPGISDRREYVRYASYELTEHSQQRAYFDQSYTFPRIMVKVFRSQKSRDYPSRHGEYLKDKSLKKCFKSCQKAKARDLALRHGLTERSHLRRRLGGTRAGKLSRDIVLQGRRG